jgi:hypothetical protein
LHSFDTLTTNVTATPTPESIGPAVYVGRGLRPFSHWLNGFGPVDSPQPVPGRQGPSGSGFLPAMTSKAPPIAGVSRVNIVILRAVFFVAVFFFAVLRAFLAATAISFRSTHQ